jgi:hypothetical protein
LGRKEAFNVEHGLNGKDAGFGSDGVRSRRPVPGMKGLSDRRAIMLKNALWFMVTLALGTGVLALNLAPGEQAFAAGDTARSVEMISNAKTKADHEALAASYEEEAKTLAAKAEEHRDMAKAYSKFGHMTEKHNFVKHCEALAEKYSNAAKEDPALAKLHRGLAATAQQ